jgi:hypothetical protein
LYQMRKCRNCGGPLEFSAKGQSRGDYCADPECRRVRDRERKRAQRAGKAAAPVVVVEQDQADEPDALEVFFAEFGERP